MAKYNLILKTARDDEPRDLSVVNVEGPRVPVKGEIIDSRYLAEYIKEFATQDHNPKYVSNFANSRFNVLEIDHIPKYIEGKLEAVVNVIALKI